MVNAFARLKYNCTIHVQDILIDLYAFLLRHEYTYTKDNDFCALLCHLPTLSLDACVSCSSTISNITLVNYYSTVGALLIASITIVSLKVLMRLTHNVFIRHNLSAE